MQSRKMSAVETAVSTAIGYIIATAANYYILPFFVQGVTLHNSAWIAVIFTVISLLRGYAVRRGFNRLHQWLFLRRVRTLRSTKPANTSEFRHK